MMNNKWILAVAILLMLPALACEVSVGLEGETPLPETAVLPTQPPRYTPTVPSWPLLLTDDFDDPESGFSQDSNEERRRFYEDGHYGLEVLQEDRSTWTWRGDVLSDLVLEVDVTPQGEAGHAGVIFRRDGTYRFYQFTLTADGRYRLRKKVTEEDWEDILDWKESRHIRTGLASNRLRVVCVGSTISLYVNGQYLDTVQDTYFAEGTIGLTAGTLPGEASTLFHFDNLQVYAPATALRPTATPTAVQPTPTVPNWPVVMSDDFDDPESGFSQSSDENRRFFYEDGLYGIGVVREQLIASAWRGGDLSDFVVEVDVIPQAEVGNGGVVFRNQETQGYYLFTITPDGRYRLQKRVAQGENWETIVEWTESPHIETGLVANRLRVVCVGFTISLNVNGQHLDTVQDTTFAEGKVGLAAGTFQEETHALFHFDNLRVYAPAPMVQPTGTPAPTATATRVPPPSTAVPPSPTPVTTGPVEFDPIVFAEGLTGELDPIVPSMSFPRGTKEVYAVWACRGMSRGLETVHVWYHDGRESATASVFWEQDAERGRDWASLSGPSGGPLPSGHYTLELYVRGRLLATGSFLIQ
jgi:hypothetical protein